MPRQLRILILGGTSEARRLTDKLAGEPAVSPILSLAGRTKTPIAPVIPFRVGGFGGVAGLTSYLQVESIELVIDATHPFAEQISAHAEAACRQAGVPLAVFSRLPWMRRAGDRWHDVNSADAAAHQLGPRPRRVFLTVGRLQLPAFEAAPHHHYLIRSIDPPEPAPKLPDSRLLLARGPFSLQDEATLMAHERIDVLVSKNSGGEATYAKIEAARQRGIPVILIRAPARAGVQIFYDLDAVLSFIANCVHQKAPAPRGV